MPVKPAGKKANTSGAAAPSAQQVRPVTLGGQSQGPLRLDLNAVESSPAVPAGVYVSTLSKSTRGLSQKGNPKMDFEFTVDEPREFTGRKFFNSMSLMDNALFGLKELALAIGLSAEEMAEVEIDSGLWVGRRVGVVATVDVWDGRDVNNIRRFISVERAEAELIK